MPTTATREFTLRIVAFISMQVGTVLMFIFAVHFLIFLTMTENSAWVLLAGAVSVVFLHLLILFKFVKKAHSWKETTNYWTTYDVELARGVATKAFLFLLGATVGAAVIDFRLWPEIWSALALLSISWLIIWFLARSSEPNRAVERDARKSGARPSV
jgi:hypothetical protein